MYASEYLSRYSFFRNALKTTPLSTLHDSLTGLVARPFILRFLQSLIDEQTPFCLTIVDLDNFKNINDNYGHRTGDEMLASVSADLVRFVGEQGVVGRYGGDEFLIVYFGCTDYDGIHDLFDEMYGPSGVFRKNVVLQGRSLYSTATVGCAVYPTDADSFDTLFALVDKTLYRGKSKGRNCFIIYVESKHAHLEIPSLAQRSLYDTFFHMTEGFDGGVGVAEKLSLAFQPMQDYLRMQRLFFIDADNRLLDPDRGALGLIESPGCLIRSGLLAARSLEELQDRCPALTRFLGSMRFESVMITEVIMHERVFGYLLFCPEIRTMHIWQETECAAAFFLSRMLAEYLYRQNGETN